VQISHLNIQLNASIDTKFNEISIAFKIHIDDIKKTVTEHHVGDDVVAISSEFGLSIVDQITKLKIAKGELHDCLSQILCNVQSAGGTGERNKSGGDGGLSNVLAGWSTIVKGRAGSSSSNTVTPMSPSAPPFRRKVIGNKKVEGIKISSSSAGQWHVFIGHLDKDTDEINIRKFLEDMGMAVTSVFQLKASQPWHAKS